jgi:hypothetical protein
MNRQYFYVVERRENKRDAWKPIHIYISKQIAQAMCDRYREVVPLSGPLYKKREYRVSRYSREFDK